MAIAQQESLIDLLRDDHNRMRELFAAIEDEDANVDRRRRAAVELLDLVYAHDRVERKYLYPFAEDISEEACRLVEKSQEAHHLVSVLLLELKAMPFGDRYFAKLDKLVEELRLHMTDEEANLFPLVESSDLDLGELGAKMAATKERIGRYSPMVSHGGVGIGALVTTAIVAGFSYMLFRSGMSLRGISTAATGVARRRRHR